MFKHFRRFLYVPLALALLFLAGIAVLSSPWFHRRLERRVTAKLESVTGARVRIGQLHFNPFILQLTLHQLVVHGSEEPRQPPLFSARNVVMRFSPLSIVRRRLMLARLDLNGAEAHILTKCDGSSNFPGPRASEASQTDNPLADILDLSMGRLTVGQTDLYWNDQRLPLKLSALNVAVQIGRESLHEYQGSLSSSAVEIDAPNLALPPTTLTARFEISQSGLNVPLFNWHTAGFNGQSTWQVKFAPSPEIHVVYKANGTAAEVGRILSLGKYSSGDVLTEGRASYEQGAWQAKGRIEGRKILPSPDSINPGQVDFSADYSADRGQLQFPQFRSSALGGTLQGQGAISLQQASPRYSLRADLRGLHLEAVLRSLSKGHPLLKYLHWASAIQGSTEASWSGRFENLNAHFDLRFQPRPGAPANSLPMNGLVRGSATNAHGWMVELEAVDVHTPHSTFTAQGALQSSQSQLAVELVTNDFEEWRAPVEFLARANEPIPLELKDPATFSGTLSGTVSQPVIGGRLSAHGFVLRGWRWEELQANVHAAPDLVEVSGSRLRSEHSVLTVDASASLLDWQLDPTGPARFAASAERTPLEGLKAALGANYPIGGLATGHIKLEGTPTKLVGGGDLRVDQGKIAGRPFDSLTTNFRVSESVWAVENIQLVRNNGRVTGHGSYDPSTRAFAANLHGANLSLADFEAGPQEASRAGVEHRLEGRAGFDLQSKGTPHNVELHADWNVQDLIVMGMPAGTLQGQLDWQDQTLRLRGESQGAGGTLRFEGKAQTEGNWPVALTANYSNFLIGPWLRLMFNSKFDTPVTAGGSFKVTGPLREPNQLAIQGQISALEVKLSGLIWKNSHPVEIRYADRSLKIGRFQIQGPSTSLEAQGTVRFGERASLALTAQGESDATLLSLLDPAVKATGRSKVNLRINGTPAHPLLFGTVQVQDLNVSYGELPFHLFGMNGEFQLEGERATVRSLQGLSGGGSVTVQGFITFAQRARFDLSAKVDQVRVQYPTDFTSQLTGTLRLTGTSENSRMEGDLIVRQLFASPNFNVINLMSEVGGGGSTPAIGAASPVAASVRLNVQVSSAPTVRLETQDLRLVADVDLRLQGTLANPVVVGSIHVLNGESVLRGNRYRLNRADISMTNPFRTQPVLEMEATTRIQRYDLTLDISGPLDRIKMAYRSDPPLPTSGILSLLALGYSRQEGELSTTGQEHFSSVGASALLSEALSSQMTGRIQRLFGVSRIKIDPNVSGPESAGGARVTVEQQVMRELTLTYITDTSSSQRRVVQFEWQVSDNVSLLGIRDRNGIFGVEVKFRRRYK